MAIPIPKTEADCTDFFVRMEAWSDLVIWVMDEAWDVFNVEQIECFADWYMAVLPVPEA